MRGASLPIHRVTPLQWSAEAAPVLTRLRSIVSFQLRHASCRRVFLGHRLRENRPPYFSCEMSRMGNLPLHQARHTGRIEFELVNASLTPRPKEFIAFVAVQ